MKSTVSVGRSKNANESNIPIAKPQTQEFCLAIQCLSPPRRQLRKLPPIFMNFESCAVTMKKSYTLLCSLLVVFSSLAGCLSNTGIDSTEQQLDESRITDLEILLDQKDEQISQLEALIFEFRTDLSNTDLSGLDLSDTDLSHSNLSEVNFSNTNLSYSDLTEADLSFANLNNTRLIGTNLVGVRTFAVYNCETAILPSSWFCRSGILVGPTVNLSGANLSELGLSDMNFHSGNFSGTNFSQAILSGGHFYSANLQGSDLSYVHLDSAYLNSAFLQNANLQDSNLRYAQMYGADLTGADFTNAILTETDLRNTTMTGVIWSDTTCPDGTNSDQNGGTCENNIIEPAHVDWD